MRHEVIFGAVSGALVFASAIPYLINAVRGTISLHAVSWSLWALIGVAMFVTYMGSGAKESLWPVVASVVNPVLVLAIILYRNSKAGTPFSFSNTVSALTSLDHLEKACLALCLAALSLYVAFHGNKKLTDLTLYLSLAADGCAAIPTLAMVWKDPTADKPGAWSIFTLGYLFAFGAISDHTIANYALPVWMVAIYGSIALITGAYRLKTRAQVQEWI